MDRGDLESDCWLHHRVAGLHQLLRHANGRAAASNGIPGRLGPFDVGGGHRDLHYELKKLALPRHSSNLIPKFFRELVATYHD